MLSLLRSLYVHAARRGDGLLPQLLNPGYSSSPPPKAANQDSAPSRRAGSRHAAGDKGANGRRSQVGKVP
jgi:hypothetical protein